MRPRLLALALTAGFAAPATAQQWRVQVGTGLAYNLPLPLAIAQRGAPELTLTARYETRALETPLYYVVRVERERPDGGAVAFELVHHKLFLTNAPAEVQRFEISHGFNVATLQRAWGRAEGMSWRVGAGVVIAHPETTVRGRAQPRGGWLDRGYYVSGPAAQLGAGWSRALAGRARAGLEAKLTGARAWVPIAEGTARLWHASAHLNAQIGLAL
jgi:hypothetical protein